MNTIINHKNVTLSISERNLTADIHLYDIETASYTSDVEQLGRVSCLWITSEGDDRMVMRLYFRDMKQVKQLRNELDQIINSG